MIDQRIKKVIEYLLERKSVPKNTLLNQLGLTINQFNYAIEKINSLLRENNQPTITSEENSISLSLKNVQFLLEFLQNDDIYDDYELNAQERKRYILFMLYYYINDELSVNHFLSSMAISKTTFMTDLRKLNDELGKYQLKISYSRKKGYHLLGLNRIVRYYVLERIFKDLNEGNLMFFYQYFLVREQIKNKERLSIKLRHYLKKYQLQLSDNRFNELYYAILFSLPRMELEDQFQYDETNLDIIKELKEYQLSGELLHDFNIDNRFSQMFVASLLLSSGEGVLDASFSDYKLLHFLVEQALGKFESIMGIEIENKSFILTQLYSHFRPAFYRIIFELPIVNFLHRKIIQEYHNIYQITKEVMQFLKPIFGKEIPEKEISFLTIYFVIIIQDYSLKVSPNLRAVIVCQSGIGGSMILQKELESLFPNMSFIGPYSISQLLESTTDFDIVFSTLSDIKLAHFQKPVYKVNPIMTNDDRVQLLKDVNGSRSLPDKDVHSLLNIIKNHTRIWDEPSLKEDLELFMSQKPVLTGQQMIKETKLLTLLDLLKINHIIIQQSPSSWEVETQRVGDVLYQEGAIEKEYIDVIISNLIGQGPYMVISENIALLHAKPEQGVNQLGLALTIFPKDFNFMGKRISLLFMLSAVDHYQHLDVISDLVKICENQAIIIELQNSKNQVEAYHKLENFLY